MLFCTLEVILRPGILTIQAGRSSAAKFGIKGKATAAEKDASPSNTLKEPLLEK